MAIADNQMGIGSPTLNERNLFFAVQPPEGVRSLLCRFRDNLCRVHGLKGRPVSRDCLHISLHSLGLHASLPEDEVGRAVEAASTLRTAPFDVALNRVVSWKGDPAERPLVLRGDEGIVGIDRLRGTLHTALADAFLTLRGHKDADPHLTLLRGDNDFPEMIVPEIRWTVREFVLVDSRVGESRHDILGRWPLTV